MARRPAVEAVEDPNVAIAAGILLEPRAGVPDNLQDVYEGSRRPIDAVEITTDQPAVNILYMSELLIGHKDSAIGFYEQTVEQLKGLPEGMRPDAAVVSGFLQGDFRFLDKGRRATLVPELSNIDSQFRYARQMLEKLQETGVPVVYNMSNDDRRIAEESTIEYFRKMQTLARGQKEINWANVDKMRQNPQWTTHLNFQTETVFPYCLRAGRRLYSAEEMAAKTGGQIDVEEYFVLFGAEQAAKKGEKPNESHEKWLEEVVKESNNDLIITDDVDLHVTTKGREYWDWVRHHMGLSSKPMYQEFMKTPMSVMGRLASSGRKRPDLIVTQHNQELAGVAMGDSWVMSTAGLTHPLNLFEASGTRSDVPGDSSRRMITSRRRIPEPGAYTHTRTDDGRDIFTFFNAKLNEKSSSIPERMTIAELCDLQTGSITARPDYQAKFFDYIRTRAIGERATAFMIGGDFLHGRNYPNFPSESQQTGLMSMASQEDFLLKLFRESFKDMSAAEVAAIERVAVEPGNHEWNSGTIKWHGYPFTTYMREFFGRMYARHGYTDEQIDKLVKSHEAVITPKGEYVGGSYTGIEYFGDMGVLIRHFLLDRGAKGSGGSLPVYQTEHMVNGAGELMKNIDVFMAGHWHHPQVGLFGDKLGLVGGSIAGLSDYEATRGYHPTIAGTLLHIGGGLPPQIEFISERALQAHKIATGGLTDAVLRQKGFRDDRNFDVVRHGIFLPDSYPKSGLQKGILAMMREASQRVGSIAELK